jgi:hypothetical protein
VFLGRLHAHARSRDDDQPRYEAARRPAKSLGRGAGLEEIGPLVIEPPSEQSRDRRDVCAQAASFDERAGKIAEVLGDGVDTGGDSARRRVRRIEVADEKIGTAPYPPAGCNSAVDRDEQRIRVERRREGDGVSQLLGLCAFEREDRSALSRATPADELDLAAGVMRHRIRPGLRGGTKKGPG